MDVNKSDNRQATDAEVNHSSIDAPADESAGTSGTEKPLNVSMEEHLERLAALNLSSTYASRSRLSPAIIRLLSAAAGFAVLLLIYLLFKLFI